jgi:DNA-binding IclR family transcriptional regulator
MTERGRAILNNQSTMAAFAILEEMAKHSEACRVTDLAAALGMPRARIYRFLQTLVTLGYVRQDPTTERYRLTLKLFHLGQAIADGTQLTSVARPLMVALRDEVRQTVTLSIPEETGMRVIDIVRVETPVQIITKPGALLPLHNSAQGKIALAFGPPSYRETVAAGHARGDAAYAGLDPDKLESQIELARKTGWSLAPEEILPGVNAVSAPIFDVEVRFVATTTVVGSVQDIKTEPDAIHVTAVTRTARKISSELGCMEYPI